VVPSKDSNARWVTDFECDKEGDGLNGVVATIYVVTYSRRGSVPAWPGHRGPG
jgi:hypothetical protein